MDRTPLELAHLLKKPAIAAVLKPATPPRIIALDNATKPLPKKEECVQHKMNQPDCEPSTMMTHTM